MFFMLCFHLQKRLPLLNYMDCISKWTSKQFTAWYSQPYPLHSSLCSCWLCNSFTLSATYQGSFNRLNLSPSSLTSIFESQQSPTSTPALPFTTFIFSAESPSQNFVTLDYSLRYYPSITYAVIGSAVIFVLVVVLLALALHHQRKRSVLLPRGVREGSHHHHHHHQPLLLSRLLILDRGHMHHNGPVGSPTSSTVTGQYSSATQALHLLSGTLFPTGSSMDSPPSYSQAVLDAR